MSLRGCLDSRKWADVRKWGSVISHFPVYSNLNFEDNDDNVQLTTLVKGVEIKLTPKSLGCILHIPYHGLTLSEIEMIDEEVF